MRKAAVATFAIGLWLGTAAAQVSTEPSTPTVSPVVQIGTEDRIFCTGVLLDRSKYILTAGHCVSNRLNAKLYVQREDGTLLPAHVAMFADIDGGMADFALLWVEERPSTWKGMGLNCETVPVGTEVEAIGYPGVFEGTVIHSWGRIAAEPALLLGFSLPIYAAQMPVLKGDSGGPVFTSDGRVFAIMVAYAAEQPGISLLQPVGPVCRVLDA